jgi:hypothetical protein
MMINKNLVFIPSTALRSLCVYWPSLTDIMNLTSCVEQQYKMGFTIMMAAIGKKVAQ